MITLSSLISDMVPSTETYGCGFRMRVHTKWLLMTRNTLGILSFLKSFSFFFFYATSNCHHKFDTKNAQIRLNKNVFNFIEKKKVSSLARNLSSDVVK